MSSVTALIPAPRLTTDQLLQDPRQLLLEFFQQRQQANYWRTQFQRAKQRETEHQHEIQTLRARAAERETELQQENQTLRARVAQLEHQLFGQKSEKKNRS
jgi:hypothetical protein